MITHIFLDMDDTLMPCGIYYHTAKEAVAQLIHDQTGTPMSQILEDIQKFDAQQAETVGFGKDRFPNSLKTITERYLGPAWGQYAHRVGEAVLQRDYPLFPNVLETLTRLRTRYWLHIVTKGDPAIQTQKAQKATLLTYVHGLHILPWKHPEHYTSILTDLGLLPDQVLMVGDSLRDDIHVPKSLGMWTCHVQTEKPTWQYENVPETPHFTIRAITDLPSFLGV